MPRPARFVGETLEKLKQVVLTNKLTPKEISLVFNIALPTVYSLLSKHDLPVFKASSGTKFYDPTWKLREAPAPLGVSPSDWGPWVDTSSIPREGTHPSIFRLFVVPISALIVAEYHTRKLPDTLHPSVTFKDGNCNNVSVDNVVYAPKEAEEAARMARKEYLRVLAEQLKDSSNAE